MSSSLHSSIRYWLCAGNKSEDLKSKREQQQLRQPCPQHLPADVDRFVLQLTHPTSTSTTTPSATTQDITTTTTTKNPSTSPTTTPTTPQDVTTPTTPTSPSTLPPTPSTTTTTDSKTSTSGKGEGGGGGRGMTAGKRMPSPTSPTTTTPTPTHTSSPSSPSSPPSPHPQLSSYHSASGYRRRRRSGETNSSGGGGGGGGEDGERMVGSGCSSSSADGGLSRSLEKCEIRTGTVSVASSRSRDAVSSSYSSSSLRRSALPLSSSASSVSPLPSSHPAASSYMKVSASSPYSLSFLSNEPNKVTTTTTTSRRANRLYRTRLEDQEARKRENSSVLTTVRARPELLRGKTLEGRDPCLSQSFSVDSNASVSSRDIPSGNSIPDLSKTVSSSLSKDRDLGSGSRTVSSSSLSKDRDLGSGSRTMSSSSLSKDRDLGSGSRTVSSSLSKDRDLGSGSCRDEHHPSHANNNTVTATHTRGPRRIQKSATTTLLTYPQRATFDFESTTPELSDAEEKEKKEEKKEKKRRFGKKMLSKKLRRSQSASCTQDVPAHALFLRHQLGAMETLEDRLGQRSALSPQGAGKGGGWGLGEGGGQPRRTSLPRPIHKTTSADAAMMSRDEFGNVTSCQNKTNKKSLAKTMKRKLQFLRRRHTDTTLSTLSKAEENQGANVDPDVALQWSRSFESLLTDKRGLELFRGFLRSEFSEENLEFWMAVEDFKLVKPRKVSTLAQHIYTHFVEEQSPREINVDSETRLRTLANLNTPGKSVFEEAQRKVQALMAKDSYPRFLESEVYQGIVRSSKC